MTFSSVSFLYFFLPITFLLYVICKNQTGRNVILVAASLFFYAYGEPFAVILMLLSVLCNYLFGLGAASLSVKKGKACVCMAVLLNIGLLIAYKYAAFFVMTFNQVTSFTFPVPEIRLPIGISFFTFQGLSYVIDVYRDKKCVQKRFFYVLLYISFFPQLIAGPIVRYQDIEKQLKNRTLKIENVSSGVFRFICGLGKKVLIANQMGIVADKVFSYTPETVGVVAAWIGAVCYTLQIFFDFSGYSDMAIGLGKIFGFDFLENFNYPLSADSIQDFWRRWHISLSTWFKEYVYIPLGGNRKGKIRTDMNKLIVFFLTGFWHGANVTFIVWGMIHGVFLLFENHNLIPVKKRFFRPFRHLYVILVTVLAFVVFRADSLSQAFVLIANMFTGKSGLHTVRVEVLSCMTPAFLCSFLLAVLFSTPICAKIREKCIAANRTAWFEAIAYGGSLLVFLLSSLLLVSEQYNPFIYFRF